MSVAVVGISISAPLAVVVSVGKTMSVAVVGISISAPLAVVVSGAVGDGSEGATGETGGVMVARESGVDVVVVDSDSVAVVSVGVSAPLAVAVGQVAVRTGTVDCALDSVADGRGPGRGDSSGSDQGVPIEGSLGLRGGEGGSSQAGGNQELLHIEDDYPLEYR